MKAMKAMKAKPKVMKVMKKAKPMFMKRTLSFLAVPDLETMPDPPPPDWVGSGVQVRLFRTDSWENPIFMVSTKIACEFLEDWSQCDKPGIYVITSKVFAPGKRLYSAAIGEVERAMFLKPCPSQLNVRPRCTAWSSELEGRSRCFRPFRAGGEVEA